MQKPFKSVVILDLELLVMKSPLNFPKKTKLAYLRPFKFLSLKNILIFTSLQSF